MAAISDEEQLGLANELEKSLKIEEKSENQDLEQEKGAKMHISDRIGLIHPMKLSTRMIPKSKYTFYKYGLDFGFLYEPRVHDLSKQPTVKREPLSCIHCGATISPFHPINFESGIWSCSICGEPNGCSTYYESDSKKDQNPELVYKTVVYENTPSQDEIKDITSPSLSSPFQTPLIGGSNVSKQKKLLFLLIDGNISENIERLLMSISNVLLTLKTGEEDDILISIITFSNHVSVYDVGRQDISSADVFTGAKDIKSVDISAFRTNLSSMISPISICRSNIIENIFPSISYAQKHNAAPRKMQQRAYGTALDVVTLMLNTFNHDGPTQVITILTGMPNLGVGTLNKMKEDDASVLREREFYRRKSKEFNDHNCIPDIICVGPQEFGILHLRGLHTSCQGDILLFREFDEAVEANMIEMIRQKLVTDASILLYASYCLRCSHILCQGKELAGGKNDGEVVSIRIGAYRGGKAIAFILDYEGTSFENMLLQCRFSYTSAQRMKITEVSSESISRNEDFIGAIDPVVTGVLLAKKWVMETLHGASLESEIDTTPYKKTLMKIPIQYGKKFSPLFSLCYHLFRGQVLGPLLMHPDDISHCRSLLVNISQDHSLLMISPNLFGVSGGDDAGEDVYDDKHSAGDVSGGRTWKELPASLDYLKSKDSVILDNFSIILIWIGSEVNVADAAYLRDVAFGIAGKRYPYPKIVTVRENSSLARLILARLAPGSDTNTSEPSYGEFCEELGHPFA